MGMHAQEIMRHLLLKIVLMAIIRKSFAQEGYSYPRPDKPFIPGTSSSDSMTNPRHMYGTSPSTPISNNNDRFGPPGQNGPGTSPGYPGKVNGYPSNQPGSQNGHRGGGQQPGQGNTRNGYGGDDKSTSTGYPKERPSVPFSDGKFMPKPETKVPDFRPNGPGVPGMQNGGPGYPSMPIDRPSTQGTGNGYLGPRGKPQGPNEIGNGNKNGSNQKPGQSFPSPGQGYLGPSQRPGNDQPGRPTNGNGNGGPSGPPYSGMGQRPSQLPSPQGPPFNGYPGTGQNSPGSQGKQGMSGGYPPGAGQKPNNGIGTQRQPSGPYNGGMTGSVGPQTNGYPGQMPGRQGTPVGFPGPNGVTQQPRQNEYNGGNRGSPQDSSRPGGNFVNGDSGFGGPGTANNGPSHDSQDSSHDDDTGQYDGDYSAIPGEPDRDYPIYSDIPSTSFRCDAQQFPGYYADTEARCQVFHICANNKTYHFLCPNGTIFHQQFFVCGWWNQFDCNTAPNFYFLNENLYDYTIMGSQGAIGQMLPNQGGSVIPGQTQGPANMFESGDGKKRPGTGVSGGGSPSNGYPNYQGGQGQNNYNGKPQTMGGQQDKPGRYPGGGTQVSTGGSFSPRPDGSTPFPGSPTTPTTSYGPPQRTQTTGPSFDYTQGVGSSTGYTMPTFKPSGRPQGPPGDYPGSSSGNYGGLPDSRRPTTASDDRTRSQSQGPGRYPGGSRETPSGPVTSSRPDVPGPAMPNREYLPPRNE